MSDASNTHHFVTRWRVPGTCGEVADILGDPVSLVRWWPSVFLIVDELEPPGPGGVGRRVRLHTRGWLPCTLRWQFEVVESSYPHGFAFVATGDLEGRGVWTIVQDGGMVDVTHDWAVTAEKPLLRGLPFLLKPIFEANHRWAMAQGEHSLTLELERRRATSDEARLAVPPPPGPITYAAAAVLGIVAVAGLGGAYLAVRAARRRERC